MSTWLASRETREARWAAEQAGRDDREHVRYCIDCTRAVRRRKPGERCAEGQRLAALKRETAQRLRREQELDRQPAPDQAPLFDLDDLVPGGGDGT